MDANENDAYAHVKVCRELRSKMYYVLGRNHVEMRRSSPSAQYWCARTAMVLGPDDVYCSPESCQAHRGCFDPEE